MSLLHDSTPGRADFVLHPTDLSEASARAFHHALAIAIRSGAQFTSLHALGRRGGGIVPGILEMADAIEADAIYMSTAWSRAGFGKVEGGVTEAALVGAPCPVATVPVERV